MIYQKVAEHFVKAVDALFESTEVVQRGTIRVPFLLWETMAEIKNSAIFELPVVLYK